MKIVYVANTRIPTEKAHGWAIMKMCESFARVGVTVELILPMRKNPAFESIDPFQHYGISRLFTIVHVPCPDLITVTSRLPRALGLVLGMVQNWLYARAVHARLQKESDAIIFSREHRLLYFLRTLPNKLVYEIHDFPEHHIPWYKKLFARLNATVVTNQWKKDELVKIFGLSEGKIFVAPNAVDVEAYAQPLSKAEARQKLSIPQNKKIALYLGGFQRWKGVYVLGEALQYIPDGIQVYFVGGGAEPDRSQFVAWLAKNADQKKYVVHDPVPHTQVSLWLWAADVLAAPGTARDDNAAFHTSPLKILEYVMAGRPVVLPDLPSVHQALDGLLFMESRAVLGEDYSDYEPFVQPDNPKVLAGVISSFVKNKSITTYDVNWEEVSKRTWQARARGIADFLEKC